MSSFMHDVSGFVKGSMQTCREALLTRMSMRPNAFTASSTTCLQKDRDMLSLKLSCFSIINMMGASVF